LKATWTSLDYPAIAWRGCTIHGIQIGQYEDNRIQFLDDGTVDTEFDDLDDTVGFDDFMLLDVDYVMRRIEPATPEQRPTYWVAPATLAFTSAGNITATISDGTSQPAPLGPGTHTTALVIADLHRIEPNGYGNPKWHITGPEFDIRLFDRGFCLYVRTPPQSAPRPFLDLAERGGLSFEQQPFG
jgi:hypothetical protein